MTSQTLSWTESLITSMPTCDVLLAQDVLAMSVVGWLLVVHRLLHGEYAVFGTAAVVGDVFADRAPAVSGSGDSRTERRLAAQLVA